jgi:hypothetical protein
MAWRDRPLVNLINEAPHVNCRTNRGTHGRERPEVRSVNGLGAGVRRAGQEDDR